MLRIAIASVIEFFESSWLEGKCTLEMVEEIDSWKYDCWYPGVFLDFGGPFS